MWLWLHFSPSTLFIYESAWEALLLSLIVHSTSFKLCVKTSIIIYNCCVGGIWSRFWCYWPRTLAKHDQPEKYPYIHTLTFILFFGWNNVPKNIFGGIEYNYYSEWFTFLPLGTRVAAPTLVFLDADSQFFSTDTHTHITAATSRFCRLSSHNLYTCQCQCHHNISVTIWECVSHTHKTDLSARKQGEEEKNKCNIITDASFHLVRVSANLYVPSLSRFSEKYHQFSCFWLLFFLLFVLLWLCGGLVFTVADVQIQPRVLYWINNFSPVYTFWRRQPWQCA